MKIKKVAPKTQEDVLIPAELSDFLKTNIYQAYLSNQVDATTLSDDAIQSSVACSGLVDDVAKIFSVSYFPNKDSSFSWSFNISLDEIREIVGGHKTRLTLWKCSFSGCQNKDGHQGFICLLHDFVDNGSGPSIIDKNIKNLSVKELLDLAFGPKKSN